MPERVINAYVSWDLFDLLRREARYSAGRSFATKTRR